MLICEISWYYVIWFDLVSYHIIPFYKTVCHFILHYVILYYIMWYNCTIIRLHLSVWNIILILSTIISIPWLTLFLTFSIYIHSSPSLPFPPVSGVTWISLAPAIGKLASIGISNSFLYHAIGMYAHVLTSSVSIYLSIYLLSISIYLSIYLSIY